MPPRIRSLTITALVAAGLVVPIACGAAAARDEAEIAFRDARMYTVRVRTEIETPFIEDDRCTMQGAGFVVDAKRGWIITNAHVAGQSPSIIRVAFADGPWRPARKIYVDSFTDVAVLAIDAEAGMLHQATLDGSNPPKVGESVGAFGHPLGLLFTGSRGIVSGWTDQAGPELMQTDATVDHGNSGGPVIRLRDGRVVGIATAGVGGTRADRVNFATPLKDVCRILDLLAQGVPPNPQRMPFSLLENEDGSKTLQVGRSFDHDRWPFEPLDRIVAIVGSPAPLMTLSDLVTALRGRSGEVRVTVERADQKVEIVAHPELAQSVLDRRALLLDGAMIAPVRLNDAAMLNDVPPFMVQSVEPGSPAQALQIGPSDMVETVDGRRFASIDSLATYLRQRPKQTPAKFLMRRWSPNAQTAFEYLVRDFPAEDLRWVGTEAPVALGDGP